MTLDPRSVEQVKAIFNEEAFWEEFRRVSEIIPSERIRCEASEIEVYLGLDEVPLSEIPGRVAEFRKEHPDVEVYVDGDLHAIVGRRSCERRPQGVPLHLVLPQVRAHVGEQEGAGRSGDMRRVQVEGEEEGPMTDMVRLEAENPLLAAQVRDLDEETLDSRLAEIFGRFADGIVRGVHGRDADALRRLPEAGRQRRQSMVLDVRDAGADDDGVLQAVVRQTGAVRCRGHDPPCEGGHSVTDDSYTVVLYARVSTDDKGQTNETQLRELREYCERNGYVVADGGNAVYTDEQTGRNDRRPGFRELKGRISEGDIDYVVARNQDRISREPQDYQNFLAFCRQFRVRVRFSDNDSKPETPDGVLFDSLQSGLAKADNIKRSTGTRKGMATAKLKGIHCGRYLAFCFSDEVEANRSRIQTEGEHRTVIMPVEGVMDLARQGLSVPKAAEVLGIGRMTLERALRSKGIDARYRELASGTCSEGMMPERVEDDRVSVPARDSSDDVQKGTLAGNEGTLEGGRDARCS